MKAEELRNRTKEFALRVIKLVGALPKTVEGRAIANQIVRSGTSVAANYRAACRARSRAEFPAKIGIVLEEADETLLCLELIIAARVLSSARVNSLLRESDGLVAIMAATRESTLARKKSEI